MSRHLRIIAAVLRKDVLSLWPMIGLTVALLVLGVVFENYDDDVWLPFFEPVDAGAS